MAASIEYVKYLPEQNPEAIISYCSNGIKTGRSKNPDVKDIILKAKKHLSAVGWSFFYIYKNQDRRELRYKSPSGRLYYSLRTACQSLVENPKKPETNSEKNDDFLRELPRNNRPKKKIRMEDVESLYLQQEREKSVVNSDIKIEGRKLQDMRSSIGSSKIEKLEEQETKSEECDDLVSNNRPKKKIRMEDVESLYLQQQRDQSVVNNDVKFEGKRLQDMKTSIKHEEHETKAEKRDDSLISNQPKKKIRMEDIENSYFQQQRDLGTVIRVQDLKSIRKKIDFKQRKLIRKVENSSFLRGRRCLLSMLIENNILSTGSRVSYCKKGGRVLAKGRVYDEGIQCDCCDQMFLISKFEVHAGSTYHRPAANIFLDDGRSILDCQNQLQLKNKVFDMKKSTDSVVRNDEFCSFCSDGGELVLCDSCTSSYHSTCIGLTAIPDSAYWFCPSCCCRICHDGNEHCQLKCGQCERQFHTNCVTKLGFSVSNTNFNAWLCSVNCERIYSALKTISRKRIALNADNLTWRLLKLDTDENDVETYSKLNVALDVMHECFQPMEHRWSDNDLVEDLIFSKSSKKSNFSGFYTAVLEKNDEMITAAAVRVHGCKAAEIPLVATRFRHRRLGMCRILMDEIEKKLGELGVERVVLPAVPDMMNTWTESFGFKVMTEVERLDLVEYRFLDFPGTIKCHKILK